MSLSGNSFERLNVYIELIKRCSSGQSELALGIHVYSKHVFIFPDGGPALKAQGMLAALFVACSLALKSF